MSHASDGELHAYLDGALDALPEDRARSVREHVESCPACRARLEEEASVRRRAQELVGAALPQGVELPSLEELKRQAAAATPSDQLAEISPETGPGRRQGRLFDTVPPRVVLAWAASLVVALGVGWLGRDVRGGWELRVAPPQRGISQDAPRAPSIEEAEELEAEPVPVVAVEGETGAGAGRAAEGSTPPEAVAGVGRGGAVRELVERERQSAAGGGDRGAGAAEGKVVESVVATGAREEAAGERRTDDLLGVAPMRAEADAVPGEAMPSAPHPGGEPMGLPGLPILSVQTTPGEEQEVRIVQVLPSGAPVELRYLRVRQPETLGPERDVMAPVSRALAETEEAVRQEAPAAVPPSRADATGWSEVVVQLGQWQVLLTGPVSEDSLQSLSRLLENRR